MNSTERNHLIRERGFGKGAGVDQIAPCDDELLSSVSERSATDFCKEELNEIITRICDVYGVTESMLASANRSRKLARIRAEITQIAMDSSGAMLAEIAKRLLPSGICAVLFTGIAAQQALEIRSVKSTPAPFVMLK